MRRSNVNLAIYVGNLVHCDSYEVNGCGVRSLCIWLRVGRRLGRVSVRGGKGLLRITCGSFDIARCYRGSLVSLYQAAQWKGKPG
jgi:hypothetical protein